MAAHLSLHAMRMVIRKLNEKLISGLRDGIKSFYISFTKNFFIFDRQFKINQTITFA